MSPVSRRGSFDARVGITICGVGAGTAVALGVGEGTGVPVGSGVVRASRTMASTVAGISGVGAAGVGETTQARQDRETAVRKNVVTTRIGELHAKKGNWHLLQQPTNQSDGVDFPLVHN